MMKIVFPLIAMLALSMPAAAAGQAGAPVPAVTHNGQAVVLRPTYVPASDFVPEMADANAAAALPPPEQDPRLAPAPGDARTAAMEDQRWQQPSSSRELPPLPVIYTQPVLQPVPVPVAFAPAAYAPVAAIGWNGGWNRGWNRGRHRGWNRGWNGGWGGAWGPPVVGLGWNSGWARGYRGGRNRGWGCRSSGSGALLGTVAGAVIGYGLSEPWNRSTGTVIGGVVGGLAGTAIERSGRC